MSTESNREATYVKGSLSLFGTISLGTGVMIGAGIFALTGQVAELAGSMFPLAFIAAAVISAFSAYSYIKVSSKYPSAGGIGMILHRAYGRTALTGAAALFMVLSMIVNESLVARTFGTYVLQLFEIGVESWLVSALALGLLVAAFVVNILGNKLIGGVAKFTALLKVLGLVVFAALGLWAQGSDNALQGMSDSASEFATSDGTLSFLAATALGILAFKGFTTITNSGDEVVEPEKNLARAIIISIATCLIAYLLVCFAVASSLTVPQIVAARDYSLAEASRPLIGGYGVWFTVAIAVIATTSGVLASMFAVSRTLAILTKMQLIPHRHFRMPGNVQHHTLVYTLVAAAALAIFFDLSRIAALGAILYLVMDMAVHYGVLRHLRKDVGARAWVLVSALLLDAIVLGVLVVIKLRDDPWIIVIAAATMLVVYVAEQIFLRNKPANSDHRAGEEQSHHHTADH